MGRKSRSRGDAVAAPEALDSQLEKERIASGIKREKAGKKKLQEEEKFLGSGATSKVLKTAKRQLREEGEPGAGHSSDEESSSKRRKPRTLSLVMDEEVGGLALSDEDDSDWEDDGNGPEWEPPEVDPEEAATLEKFMAAEPANRRTLADIIQAKIREKEMAASAQLQDVAAGEALIADIPPPVLDMYEGVRDVLKTYRSGRLPKAFKMIPMLHNWEQVLQITEPENWSSAAMYQATRVFVSNLSAKRCQRFLNLVLLPRVRDDIAESGKLNFHLYQGLRKALYKPAAFFKGMLIPLCEEGTCTLREATIIGSVLTKTSIPMLHAAAAMLMIAEMDYSGTNSLFLRLLLDKAYTLPYRVIDALVAHFARFMLDQREMPVLWQQSLLVFVQRYKADIAAEQREQILDLIKAHPHYQITPEIRRELSNVKPRDVEDNSAYPQDMDE